MKRIIAINLFFILLIGIAFTFSATDSNNDLNFGQTGNAFGNANNGIIDTNFSLGEKTFSNANNATLDLNMGIQYVSAELPSVTITSPTNGQSTTETTIVLSYSGTSKEPIIKYFVKKDSDAWIDNGLNTSYAFSGLGIGAHSFFVIAKNSVDLNSNQASISITITQSQQVSGTSGGITGNSSTGGTTKVITEETIDRIEIFTVSTSNIVQNMALNEIAGTGITENKKIALSNDIIISRRMIEKTKRMDGQLISSDLNFNVSAKNVSGTELKNIELIEKVPKEIAENTKSINFTEQPTILKEDPLFEWLFDLNVNEIKDFNYNIKGVSDKSILKDLNSFFKNLAIPTALVPLEAKDENKCKGINCNDKNPCTVDYCVSGNCIHSANDGIYCDNNKVCYQGQCIEKKAITENACLYSQIAWLGNNCETTALAITITTIIIAIAVGLFFFTRKHKKHSHQEQKAKTEQETKIEIAEKKETKEEKIVEQKKEETQLETTKKKKKKRKKTKKARKKRQKKKTNKKPRK